MDENLTTISVGILVTNHFAGIRHIAHPALNMARMADCRLGEALSSDTHVQTDFEAYLSMNIILWSSGISI